MKHMSNGPCPACGDLDGCHLKASEPHQVHSFICARCAVWRPKEEVTFHSMDDAEDHALQFHSNRLLKAYREVAEYAATELGRWPAVRSIMLSKMLMDHNADVAGTATDAAFEDLPPGLRG